jgi:hypothetical protein
MLESPEDDLDRELSVLAAATSAVKPRRDFVERAMKAILPGRTPSFGDGVMRFGTAMLAIATLSAAFAVAAGMKTERTTSDAFASAYWVEDFDW